MLENFTEKINDCGGSQRRKKAKGSSFLICTGCWKASEERGLDSRSASILTDLNYDQNVLDLANAVDGGQKQKVAQLQRMLSQKWDPNFVLTKPKNPLEKFGDEELLAECHLRELQLLENVSDKQLMAEVHQRRLLR